MPERGENPGRGVLERARTSANLTARELWVRYLGLGGDASPSALDAFLIGTDDPTRREYNILVDALNERLMDLGLARSVRYAA